MTYSPIPKWNITDTNGAPVVNGTLEFFEAGTTTPKDVFSDADRTVSAGDTLTTDALGQVGPVYLDTAAATKVVCKDASAVTLWTVDNLTAPAGESVTALTANRAVSPLDYGAVGDGAADESTQVQQAIDANRGFVDLAGKTYRCDSAITLRDGLRMINGTLDFSNLPSGSACISAVGGAGAAVFATSTINGGDKNISLTSSTTIAAGGWVRISSNAEWGSTYTDGELALVDSIVSGTEIKLDGRVVDRYTTGDAAKVEPITTKKDIVLEDVQVIGSTALTTIDVLLFQYCERVSLRNVRVSAFAQSAVRYDNCAYCSIDGFDARSSADGYGIWFTGASTQCTASDVFASEVNAPIVVGGTDGGVCRFISIANSGGSVTSDAAGSFGGITLAVASQYCLVANCSMRCGEGLFAYGVIDQGDGNQVHGCHINGATKYGVYRLALVVKAKSHSSLTYSDNFSYSRNTVTGSPVAFYIANGSANAGTRGDVSHNTIPFANDSAVDLLSTNGLSGITVHGNTLGRATRFLRTLGSGVVSDIRVTGNIADVCEQFASVAIDSNSNDIEISDNTACSVTGSVNIGIAVTVTTGNVLTGLNILRNDLRLVDATATVGISVQPVDSRGVQRFAVDDNRLTFTDQDDNRFAIEVEDGYGGTISRNRIDGASVVAGIQFKGSAALGSGPTGQVVIFGNVIRLTGTQASGTPESTGIEVDCISGQGVADVTVSSNSIEGHSSGTPVTPLIKVAAATTTTIERFAICNNRLNGSTRNVGISVVSADTDGIFNGVISGNLADAFEECLILTKVKSATVSGNNFRTAASASQECVLVTGCEALTVSGNTLVRDNNSNPSICVDVNESDTVLVSSNIVSGGYQGIQNTPSGPSEDLVVSAANARHNSGSAVVTDNVGSDVIGTTSTLDSDFTMAVKSA